jgi:glyoxylase-like metal-dependent hydrolase (beta-lactamase superfamily II)
MFSRRELLKGVAALAATPVQEILPGLRVVQGAVNSALLERRGKRLLIDSGDLSASPDGGAVEWILFTHHHRDQASGVAQLAAAGAKVAVPAVERDFFERAREFWDSADSILDHRYNLRPHLFTLRESAPVSRALKGGDAHLWEGLKFEVIHTPGHTDGSVTYLVEMGGKRVAFTGDLIYGPGQIWEIYSLQKRFPGMSGDYWGFGGAVEEVKASLDRVLERRPDILVPSHGVIMDDPASAVARLKQNLDAVMENYLTTAAWRIYFRGIYPAEKPPMLPPLPAVPYPPWIRNIASTTKAIVADDKAVFVADCGHPKAVDELARLRAAGEIGPVEGLWISHYHDDHTEFVNAAKRRFGAKVYVQREMVDIIENPTAYQMPCLFPESIRVDRALEHGETWEWKRFKFTACHFPGQTLYHGGLLVERDGFKVFFVGDSFANWGVDDYCSQNRCLLGRGVGYEKCIQVLLEARPDILMAAHWGPVPVSPEYLEKSRRLFEEREKLCQRLFPYDNVNFGLDPQWIRAYPYRQSALPGARVEIEARVLNHSARPKQVQASLRLPEGWKPGQAGQAAEVPARREGRIRLYATAPARPARRRHVLGLSVTFDGRPLGEVAEALVSFLE